jgi:low molecular weight phosphotyrosine protein phosphatase
VGIASTYYLLGSYLYVATIMSEGKINVLFVCLGNICRSTMAEGIFRTLAKQDQYKDRIGTIDSCGTGTWILSFYPGFPGFYSSPPHTHTCAPIRNANRNPFAPGAYHEGSDPDDRTMTTLESYGITDYTHAARKLRASDFANFDYIFAMDRSNFSDLQRHKKPPNATARVMLFGEYSGTGKNEVVQDPYYGGKDGFEKAYQQCLRYSKNFLKDVVPDVEA